MGSRRDGSDNGKFTIRIHHSGIFITLGKTEYVGGKFSHVDHCDADEMSLIELSNMANEIGLQGQFAFYCNRGRGVVNDRNGLVLIQTDIDAMNLAKFVDKNRMVGVFIDHQNGLQNESVGEVLQELPNGVEERTVEPVGVDVTNLDCPVFEGVFERAHGMDVEGADGVDVEELVYIESPVHSEREHSTENLHHQEGPTIIWQTCGYISSRGTSTVFRTVVYKIHGFLLTGLNN